MYEMRVLVKQSPIKKYPDSDGNVWVEAREGNEFSLKLKNNSWRRVLAVVSVDGLNVINGKHESPDISPGYILSPNRSLTVPGWRIDNEKVRKFIFSKKEDSYSKKIGANMENIGVLAAAIFEERNATTWNVYPDYNWPWTIRYKDFSDNAMTWTTRSAGDCQPNPTPYESKGGGTGMSGGAPQRAMFMQSEPVNLDMNSVTYAASCSVPDSHEEKLAVGSGKKVNNKVENGYFGARVLEAMLTVYYDTREGLEKRGIKIFSKEFSLPKPFPNTGFCPDVRTT